jgi:hypothetical protein
MMARSPRSEERAEGSGRVALVRRARPARQGRLEDVQKVLTAELSGLVS